VNLQPGLPHVSADITQLHQVLMNLCVNARDAMPRGGTLTITTSLVEWEDLDPPITNPAASRYVAVGVVDTGVGLDPQIQERIFDPFFTTKELGKGTGLELALVRSIVVNHGGTVSCASAPGKGATFRVFLPAEESSVERARPVERADGEEHGGAETVLIIENEEMLLELVRTMLVSKGYNVQAARDGHEGVSIFARLGKEIAVVVLDLGLPGLSGEEVFDRIRAIDNDAKIILASGFIDPDLKAGMTRRGATHFIRKPYSREELLRAIRAVIDGD